MKNIAIIIFIYFASLSLSYAHQNKDAPVIDTLIVSDIDDTIKLSHILSPGGAIARAADSDSWFYGINNLYQLLTQDNGNSLITYISAAPEFILEGTHKKLLLNGKFPRGLYIARTEFISGKEHKLNAIRHLINEYNPKKVIFIGDNGERDSIVYNQITKEYKNISFFTFIRFVYSKQNKNYSRKLNPIFKNQFLFVTPLEVALELYRQKNLTNYATRLLAIELSDKIINEPITERRGVLAFPEFVDCRGFKWPFNETHEPMIREVLDDQVLLDKLEKIKEKIKYRCSLEMN